ncbi:stem cell self-renewal protein Piwi, partial [Mollisia scopiformis]
LKFNFKNGGTNHRVHSLGIKPNTMIVGADVTHPGRDADETCPSLAGTVATYEESHAHYLASARMQKKNEHIEQLSDMMFEHLQAYYTKRKKVWPDHILFYRDGVSESQYGMVKTDELPEIKAAIERVRQTAPGRNYMPKITLVVVGKRHHSRFYPANKPEDSRSLCAGHVMDTNVVIPHAFNFYLQSHDSALGTAKPAHYVVIVDESGYGGGKLQEVTNDLCSLGSRSMNTLSVCTPARYADLLCNRLRVYMKPVMDGKLDIPEINAVNSYQRNRDIWGIGRNTGNNNPWHENVKDVMFYL